MRRVLTNPFNEGTSAKLFSNSSAHLLEIRSASASGMCTNGIEMRFSFSCARRSASPPTTLFEITYSPKEIEPLNRIFLAIASSCRVVIIGIRSPSRAENASSASAHSLAITNESEKASRSKDLSASSILVQQLSHSPMVAAALWTGFFRLAAP